MKKTAKLIAVLITASLFLTGCTVRVVDFTMISTKNLRVPTKERGPRTTGESCVFVFFIPLGAINMKEAIDNAIENAGPEYDALVDGVVYNVNKSFIIGQICIKVEGTPVNTKASVSMLDGNDMKHLMLHSGRTRQSHLN